MRKLYSQQQMWKFARKQPYAWYKIPIDKIWSNKNLEPNKLLKICDLQLVDVENWVKKKKLEPKAHKITSYSKFCIMQDINFTFIWMQFLFNTVQNKLIMFNPEHTRLLLSNLFCCL